MERNLQLPVYLTFYMELEKGTIAWYYFFLSSLRMVYKQAKRLIYWHCVLVYFSPKWPIIAHNPWRKYFSMDTYTYTYTREKRCYQLPTCSPCPSPVVVLYLKIMFVSSGVVLDGDSLSDLREWDCLSFWRVKDAYEHLKIDSKEVLMT